MFTFHDRVNERVRLDEDFDTCSGFPRIIVPEIGDKTHQLCQLRLPGSIFLPQSSADHYGNLEPERLNSGTSYTRRDWRSYLAGWSWRGVSSTSLTFSMTTTKITKSNRTNLVSQTQFKPVLTFCYRIRTKNRYIGNLRHLLQPYNIRCAP